MLFLNQPIFSQSNINLYNYKNTFQSNLLNPAIAPDFKMSFNFGDIYLSAYTPYITLKDIFTPNISPNNTDSFFRNFVKDPNLSFNNLAIQTKINPIFVGFTSKDFYFSFGMELSLNIQGSPPKDLLGLTQGTTFFENVLKRQIDLSNINLNSTLYYDYHVGVTHQINSQLSVGVRLKYLQGIFNAQINQSTLKIASNADSLYIEGGGSAKIAGLSDYVKDDFNLNKTIFEKVNSGIPVLSSFKFSGQDLIDFYAKRGLVSGSGLGIDLGFNYKFNNNFSISASVLDLGYINWHSYITNYTLPNKIFIDKGENITDFKLDKDRFDKLQDTLIDKVFKPEENSMNYTSYTNTKLYLGSQYTINKRNKVDFVLFNDFGEPKFNPAILVAFTKSILRNFMDFRVSTLYYNQSFNALGLGTSFNFGPIQLYLFTDNVLNIINYESSNYFNFRAGVNINIGRKNKILSRKHFDQNGYFYLSETEL